VFRVAAKFFPALQKTQRITKLLAARRGTQRRPAAFHGWRFS